MTPLNTKFNSQSHTPIRVGGGRPYENDQRKNSACSYQSLAMANGALRIAITCSCQECLFFIPRSGRVRSFSTCGTAVEFFANISSVRAVWPADARATGNRFCFHSEPVRAGRTVVETGCPATLIPRRFLGVAAVTLRRFHRVYTTLLPKYASPMHLMGEVAIGARAGSVLRRSRSGFGQGLGRRCHRFDDTRQRPANSRPPRPPGTGRRGRRDRPYSTVPGDGRRACSYRAALCPRPRISRCGCRYEFCAAGLSRDLKAP